MAQATLGDPGDPSALGESPGETLGDSWGGPGRPWGERKYFCLGSRAGVIYIYIYMAVSKEITTGNMIIYSVTKQLGIT